MKMKRGQKVYSKTPDYRYGYNLFYCGFGLYRVENWFDMGDGTLMKQQRHKLGYWNAVDAGEWGAHEMVMAYWPTSPTLTNEIKIEADPA